MSNMFDQIDRLIDNENTKQKYSCKLTHGDLGDDVEDQGEAADVDSETGPAEPTGQVLREGVHLRRGRGRSRKVNS